MQLSKKLSMSSGLSEADTPASACPSSATGERHDDTTAADLWGAMVARVLALVVCSNGLFSYLLRQILSSCSLLAEEQTSDPWLFHAQFPKLCIWAISSTP